MREKFGRFVLLDEVDTTGLGIEYRAAKLGPAGFERLVSVIRFAPALSTNREISKDVLEHVKETALLDNPYILKVHGIGKIEASYYISYEFVEGRNLRAILARCRQEGFPFSANHTLLIASKICSALGFAHSRRADPGHPSPHGLLTPPAVVLSNDGEVRVRFFGIGRSRIREAGVLGEDDLAYVAPEQANGRPLEAALDVHALGAILFECLTGERYRLPGRDEDVAARLATAQLQDPSVEPRTIPPPVAEILQRSLAADPMARYATIDEMRKAIDTLLFSGDFTPTTFNLAFLMHSLFREQLERETVLIKQEREASYAEFMVDDTAASTVARPAPAEPTVVMRQPAISLPKREGFVPEPRRDQTEPMRVDSFRPTAYDATVVGPRPAATSAPRRTIAVPLVLGGLATLLIGGLGAYLITRRGAAPVTPPPPTAEMRAALGRVQELEARLRAMETEKAAAEARAAEEAKRAVEAQARQRGQRVDPDTVRRAQEDAARRAREEQQARRADLARQLEQSQNEARAAQQRQAPAPASAASATTPAPVAATTVPLTTTIVADPSFRPLPPTLPIETPGLAATTDAGGTPSPAATTAAVFPPTLQAAPRLAYPPLALRQRIEGTVEIRAFVNEQGVVADTQVVRGVAGKAGLNEAALENVRQRRYRPATQAGAAVGTWITVRVEFRLPR